MLIWGGAAAGGATFFPNGATYDPSTDHWALIPSSPGRFIPSAAWTGAQLLVWGGIEVTDAAGHIDAAASGARYSP